MPGWPGWRRARMPSRRSASPDRRAHLIVPRLVWSPAALRDVARLYGFLARDSRDAARRAAAAIRHGVRPIAEHPQIGRPVEDMAAEFRTWPIGFGASGYVVLYRYDGSEIVILAVRHGREAGE